MVAALLSTSYYFLLEKSLRSKNLLSLIVIGVGFLLTVSLVDNFLLSVVQKNVDGFNWSFILSLFFFLIGDSFQKEKRKYACFALIPILMTFDQNIYVLFSLLLVYVFMGLKEQNGIFRFLGIVLIAILSLLNKIFVDSHTLNVFVICLYVVMFMLDFFSLSLKSENIFQILVFHLLNFFIYNELSSNVSPIFINYLNSFIILGVVILFFFLTKKKFNLITYFFLLVVLVLVYLKVFNLFEFLLIVPIFYLKISPDESIVMKGFSPEKKNLKTRVRNIIFLVGIFYCLRVFSTNLVEVSLLSAFFILYYFLLQFHKEKNANVSYKEIYAVVLFLIGCGGTEWLH